MDEHWYVLIPLLIDSKTRSHVAMPFPALYGSAISFAVLGLTQTSDVILVMSLLTSIIVMNSTIYNGLFSNHADLSPNYVGVLMGLSNTIGNISSVLAPLFVGIVVTDPVSITYPKLQEGKIHIS